MDRPADEELGAKPLWYFSAPGFTDLDVAEDWCREEGMTAIRYYGWGEDLIALRIATAEMLAPTGRRRRDADGYPCQVTRWWKARDGQQQRHYKVTRYTPTSRLDRLPWAREAIEARTRREAWENARVARFHTGGKKPKRPRLTLIVDNTRNEKS